MTDETRADAVERTPRLFSRGQILGTGLATWVGGMLAVQGLLGLLWAALLAHVVMFACWLVRAPKAGPGESPATDAATVRMVIWASLAAGWFLAYLTAPA